MVENDIFPARSAPPSSEQTQKAILACLRIQQRAIENGKQPFAAVLVGPDNDEVLLTHSNTDHVNHAESSLARLAAEHYTQRFLWRCTLYTTWEPCAMCTATCYWANIGRIVYAASEERLAQLTGMGNEKNMTMAISCRKVLEGSQKDLDIIGPVAELEDQIVEASDAYWRSFRK
ncbi:hypothetical protein D0862_01664 [Hortaea werneckii]|uniref:CMP/dCMP-type deaminase domain-containing protein n=1 Tax=Hortaea werneckii TaxID=91943 RepID=A0A3M7HQK0_HORWE|nr:hypothetical protein D0862_01664 [Hortaea werneckii]